MDSAAGDQAERFARALESPTDDPDFEVELAIVAAIHELGPELAPDDLARERMRQRVLAKRKPAVSSRRSRFVVAVAAALVLVFALAGMSLLLSRDALPGDALYGIKRTGEAASLGLTFGDESKALKHLEFAAARVTEMESLAQLHPNPADAPVGGYLTALTDFDNDITQASRQIIALATRGQPEQLGSLKAWIGEQDTHLAALEPHLPNSTLERMKVSRQLLARIAERAEALMGRMDCYQITTGGSDEIGALPSDSACHRPAANNETSNAPTAPAPPANPKVKTSEPQTPPPRAPGEQQPTPPVPPVNPQVPLVPASPPSTPNRPADPTVPQLPLPGLTIPPLLPGLPAIRIG
ncbi:DUF5667 domain-containing protein [Actinocrispum sp. NPDC049592]|uniref:DUF5667 domain-containing protein n=1 Tax=Actinocrispum sp. NPDC049592 TaxID=3154835 RepID=UPI003424BF84